MSIRVVALVSVNEDEPKALAEYLAATSPLLVEVGARIVERLPLSDTVAGETKADTMLVVEYPDRAAVDRVFSSKEYEAIRPVRDRAFSHYSVSVVCG